MPRSLRFCLFLLGFGAFGLVLQADLHAQQAPQKAARILMVTQSAGFRHGAVTRKEGVLSPAERAITELGVSSGLFRVDCTQDVARDFAIGEHVPLLIGAGGGPKTFAWIARHADGWMTAPQESDVKGNADRLRKAWAEAGRSGEPAVHVLATSKPTPELLAAWEDAGVTEAIWGLPDRSADEVVAFIGRHAGRVGLG